MEQPYLDGFLDAEAQARESRIDPEAFLRNKKAVALRLFKSYRLCKDEKRRADIMRQYNLAATMKQRT